MIVSRCPTEPKFSAGAMQTDETPLRLDIWLYRTRFFKTRPLATRFIKKGKIRLTRHNNVQRVTKPGFRVLPGDHITFMRARQLMEIDVISYPPRRGPAQEAQTHYSRHDT